MQENANPQATQIDPQFRRARYATTVLFLANGIVMASWASRVPAVQQKLNVSAGQLGLALLGMAVGGLIAMPLAATLTARFNHRQLARLSSLLLCFALPLPALAFNAISLFITLVILGGGVGALNVVENAQGNIIEAEYPRPIMASFHALFSSGGVIGALIGSAMTALHVAPIMHLSIVAGLMIVVVLCASQYVVPVSTPPTAHAESRPPLSHTLRALLGLGVIAFSTVFVEGAISDWSAVYLRREVGTTGSIAALGYAAFATTMVLGRATGDWLSERFGDQFLVRTGALIGAIGLGLALLFGGMPMSIIGFACTGIGCACVFPTLIRAAGRIRHISSGASIAAISTAGFMGFFIGPPLIGLLADHFTLRGALILLVAGDILIALLSSRLAARTEEKPHEAYCY